MLSKINFRTETDPVAIGDCLSPNGHVIVKKAGLGNSASIWLARAPHESGRQQSQLVVVKVLQSTVRLSPVEADLARKESRLKQREEVGRAHVLLPTDAVHLVGRDGLSHDVLILPRICGASVFEFAKGCPDGRLEWVMGRKAIRDTASGLAFLHRHGIGHGDLHTRNLLLIPGRPIEYWPETEVMEYFDRKPVDILPPLLAFEDMQRLARFNSERELTFDGSIMITDFGSSFYTSAAERPASTESRTTMTAPERLTGRYFDLSSDIWSLGCTMLEIWTGADFFKCNNPSKVTPEEEKRQMAEKMQFLTEDAGQINDQGLSNSLLLAAMKAFVARELGFLPEELREEAEQIQFVIANMLRYRPEDRLTTDQVEAVVESMFKHGPGGQQAVEDIHNDLWCGMGESHWTALHETALRV